MRTRYFALAALTALTLGACSQETQPDTQAARFDLTQAASCDDLLGMLRADAKTKVHATASSYLSAGPYGYHGGVDTNFGGSGGTTAGGGGAAGGAPAPPSGHSETNNQVGGVDEADIVKTDGEHLYVLHGEELYVIDSWPAQSLAIDKSIGIEGQPYEMFVEDGKAIVFSRANLEKPTGSSSSGSAGAASGASSPYPYYGGNFTKITVIDVTSAEPTVLRESYVEGGYTSSRRHGKTVRAVINGGLQLPPEVYSMEFLYQDYAGSGFDFGWPSPANYDKNLWKAAVEGWRQKALAAIDAAPLSSWLPAEAEKKDGVVSWTAPNCTKFYAPAPGMSDDGVVQVVSLELNALSAPLGGVAILGAASEVYANHSVMLLAHQRWGGSFAGWSAFAYKEETVLHRFALGDTSVAYTASGKIPGHIHDQFSLDEQDGIVRVSTTERVPDEGDWNSATVNRLLTLSRTGSKLEILGDTGPLAKGETIYSTRFVGNRGYIVTFRQVDPLFVVDLANPAAPTVLGELKIPGFSDYMHPLGPGHLLTIGRDTEENEWGGVTDKGLALQIFDVQDPEAPTLSHKKSFQGYGYSEANHEHKAFTFWAEKGLLGFPYVGYGDDYGSSFKSTLEVFKVDATSGFTQLGSIDHTALTSELCEASPYGCGYGYGYGVEVRRGVFIDDFVYSVSYGGVLVHHGADLSTPVATLPLPAPKGYPGYYY